MEKKPMTLWGYEKLNNELNQLKTVERPHILKQIAEARALGDLSENAEYHSAKERQSFTEGRIKELESLISFAEIIDINKISGDTIKFGATVVVIDLDTDKKVKYQILSDIEADIEKGIIANTSPLGRALIGKKTGDFVDVITPGGVKSWEIESVCFCG